MGLAPEGVSEYITQRGRWCLGFMQIARSKWGVLGSATLPAIDRISLFDAFLYWGTSFPFRILCLIAPLVYEFTGLAVIHADAQGALEHYAPSLCTTMIVLAWLTRGRVLPIVTDAGHQVLLLSTSWATLSGRAAVPLGAGVVLQLEGVSEPLTARVSKLGKDSLEVTFETTPSLHDAIIRKLFSGRYQLRPARFRFSDVIVAIAGRLAS